MRDGNMLRKNGGEVIEEVVSLPMRDGNIQTSRKNLKKVAVVSLHIRVQ